MATNRATRYPGRWGAVSADYPMGVPKNRTSDTAKDGSYFEKDWIADYEAYFGAVLDEAGETVDGTTDTAQNSQLHKAMQKAREVSPLNNDWNGYLDPDHQSSLPSGAGYPGNSGGGEVAYAADEEISYGIYAGASGATVSSDDDGWIVSAGSIYKLFTLTAEQLALIDVTTVPIFLKDQAGAAYFVNHNGTTINVTKPSSTTLKVEITSGIFAGLSITKLWRFFVTEKAGYVGELSADDVERSVRGGYIVRTLGDVTARIWPDGKIVQEFLAFHPEALGLRTLDVNIFAMTKLLGTVGGPSATVEPITVQSNFLASPSSIASVDTDTVRVVVNTTDSRAITQSVILTGELL